MNGWAIFSRVITMIIFRGAADGRGSSAPRPRRWCLQTEISASVIRRGRRKKPRWLCLGGGKVVAVEPRFFLTCNPKLASCLADYSNKSLNIYVDFHRNYNLGVSLITDKVLKGGNSKQWLREFFVK